VPGDDPNKKYPWPVSYQFNSRGYRDTEWPSPTELVDCLWCIGDSATLGVGAPVEHCWPKVLEKLLDQRTINVSMLSASNDFVARKTLELLTELQPRVIICNWTFLSRRDRDMQKFITEEKQRNWNEFYNTYKDPSWPDCNNISELPENLQKEIQEHYIESTVELNDEMYLMDFSTSAAKLSEHELVSYFIELISAVEAIKGQTEIIHMLLPRFGNDKEIQLTHKALTDLGIAFIQQYQIDNARDGYHWDIDTSTRIADSILKKLT
jgi:hypothetical protein